MDADDPRMVQTSDGTDFSAQRIDGHTFFLRATLDHLDGDGDVLLSMQAAIHGRIGAPADGLVKLERAEAQAWRRRGHPSM